MESYIHLQIQYYHCLIYFIQIYICRSKKKGSPCGVCAKLINGHLQRHFDRKHHGIQAFAYDGKISVKDPWCKNWKDVLEKDAQPEYYKKRGARKSGAFDLSSIAYKNRAQSMYPGYGKDFQLSEDDEMPRGDIPERNEENQLKDGKGENKLKS